MHFDIKSAFEAMAREHDPAARWKCFTAALARLGLDQINYGFLDFELASRMEARGDPAMSTMSPDWIAYYSEKRYDMVDDIVDYVRNGHVDPIIWSGAPNRIPHYRSPVAMQQAVEAGLLSGLAVPLAGQARSASAAGVMLGSSMPEAEFLKATAGHTHSLVAFAHVFHVGAVGELMRLRRNIDALTTRERDCLQYVAEGLRPDAIAEKLNLARVTVDMHLRNARRKMGARTSAEAVGRALLYQQIVPA